VDGRTVFNTILQHQLRAFLRCFPPRCDAASWRFAAEVCELLVGLVEDSVLLFEGHSDWVLVRVAVEASASSSATTNRHCSMQDTIHLVSGVSDHGAFLGERLQRMAGYKPCRLDLVFFEELEKTSDSDRARKDA